MKLEYNKQLDIKRLGNTDEGLESGIARESLPFIFELVSKKMYTNPIGSVIREITSNCFDSHLDAGTEEPVVISKTYDAEEGYSIEFKDVGTGMSPELMERVYINWFSSTRRENNDFIGAFGIGSKTPLSYTDLFYITTIWEGRKYEYVFHRGDKMPMLESLLGYEEPECEECDEMLDELNEVDEKELERLGVDIDEYKALERPTKIVRSKIPSSEPTDEHNGTVIKVVMERNDVDKFQDQLRKQLAYFDNVYFKGWNITNDYDIYEGEWFKFRSDIDATATEVHICIGNVRYEIDPTIKQNIPPEYRYMPVAVKFKIGELPITPSREALVISPAVSKLIKDRVRLACEEVVNIFVKQNPVIDNLRQYVQASQGSPRITFNEEKHHTLYLWSGAASKKFRFKPIDHLPIKKIPPNMFMMWEITGRIQGKEIVYASEIMSSALVARGEYIIMEKDDKQSMYTNLCIGQTTGRRITIRRSSLNYHSICSALGLKSNGRFGDKETTAFLKKAKIVREYVKIMDDLVYQNGVTYKSLRATDEWIAEYKRSVIESSAEYQRRMNRMIFVRNISHYGNTGDMKVYDLQVRKGILVYGFREDKQQLQQIWNVARHCSPGIEKAYKKSQHKGEEALLVITISRAAEKELLAPFIKSQHDADNLVYNNNPNIYYWEDFLKHKIIRKALTARYMKNKLIDMQLPGMVLRKKLLKNFGKEYDEIDDLTRKYYPNGHVSIISEGFDDYIPEWKKMVDRFVTKYTFKVPLISQISNYMPETQEEFIDYVAYLKHMKIRLENRFYLKTPEQLKAETEDKYRTVMYRMYLLIILESFKHPPTTKLLTFKTINNGEDNTTQEGGENEAQ